MLDLIRQIEAGESTLTNEEQIALLARAVRDLWIGLANMRDPERWDWHGDGLTPAERVNHA